MIILTTDPSLTAFGYAIIEHNQEDECKILRVGCIQTAAYPRPKKGKPRPAMLKSEWENLRLRAICDTLRQECVSFNVNRALYEDPAGSKDFNAIRALGEIKGLCIGFFSGMGIPFEGIRAKTVKKALTSNIDADKEQVEAVVINTFPEIEDLFALSGITTKVKREAIFDAVGVYCTWTLTLE